MLVLRLETALDNIINYESLEYAAEITTPILQRLDLLERKVGGSKLFTIPKNREDNSDGKSMEKRRRTSTSIKDYCLQALQITPQTTYKDIYKINAILSLHSAEDPFERYVKQGIEYAMHEATDPILAMLDKLEDKVKEYESLAITLNDTTSLPGNANQYALTWHDGDMKQEEISGEVANDEGSDGQSTMGIPQENKNVAMVVFGEGKKIKKRQMIVRITSWRYTTSVHPDISKVYLDLTKKSMDLLVEASEDSSDE